MWIYSISHTYRTTYQCGWCGTEMRTLGMMGHHCTVSIPTLKVLTKKWKWIDTANYTDPLVYKQLRKRIPHRTWYYLTLSNLTEGCIAIVNTELYFITMATVIEEWGE